MDTLLKLSQKLFFSFGFLFLVLCFSPTLTNAQSASFKVSVDPLKPEYPQPYTVTVATENGASYFKSSDTYIIRVHRQEGGAGCESQGLNVGANHPRYKAEITEAGSKIVFTDVNKEGDGGCLGPGTYKWSLYAQKADPSNLVASTTYIVTQKGGGNISIQPTKTIFTGNESITVNLINARKGQHYTFWWDGAIVNGAYKLTAPEDGNQLNLTMARDGADFTKSGKKKLCVMNTSRNYNTLPANLKCEAFVDVDYRTFADPNAPPTSTALSCEVIPKNPKADESISLSIKNAPANTEFRVDLNQGSTNTPITPKRTDSSGNASFNAPSKTYPEGSYTFFVYNTSNNQRLEGCSPTFTIGKVTNSTDKRASVEKCEPGKQGCSSAAGEIKKDNQGNQCVGTAIGCIPTNLNAFINALLVWTAGIAGGIAFLMMIYGSFQMITSQGNADQLKKGREQFVAAISGLLFIIFSITLLQIIGADILGIPGFAR